LTRSTGPGGDSASIVAELLKFRDANRIPKVELTQADGYDEDAMPAGHLLNRDDLDTAFPDNPVLVRHVGRRAGVCVAGVKDGLAISSGSTNAPPAAQY